MKGTVKGLRAAFSGNSFTNAVEFMNTMMINRVNTAIPVRVESVTPVEEPGPEEPAGYISATPLICQTDAWNKTLDQPAIPKMPYFRHQGGKAAVILDPVPGDVGLAVFCHSDISRIPQGEEKPEPVQPGSFRKFDKADGVYLGGMLGQAPETWLELKASEGRITIHGPDKVIIETKEAEVHAEESCTVETKTAEIKVEESCTVEAMTAEINATQSLTVNTVEMDINASARIGLNTPRLTAGTGQSGMGTAELNMDIRQRGNYEQIGDYQQTGNHAASGNVSAGNVNAGKVEATEDVISASISLRGHYHGGVLPGGFNTGGPR